MTIRTFILRQKEESFYQADATNQLFRPLSTSNDTVAQERKPRANSLTEGHCAYTE